MTNKRLVLLVVAVAAVSIVAVVVSGGPDDEEGKPTTEVVDTRPRPAAPEERKQPDRSGIPDDPEEVFGNAEYALQRPRNLSAALRVLERQAQEFEGRFDYLRIAPGRIDTTLQRSDRRRTLQLRADLKIPFSAEHEFPSGQDALARVISAREVDPQMPRRILNAIDVLRPAGSAARDLDYMVVSKSIIDRSLDWSAYLQSGPRPRQFSVEGGPRGIRLRVIG